MDTADSLAPEGLHLIDRRHAVSRSKSAQCGHVMWSSHSVRVVVEVFMITSDEVSPRRVLCVDDVSLDLLE